MAMMISKFNKIIHNKTVWLVFAIFISIAFVSVYTGSRGSRQQARMHEKAEIAGRLYGENVSRAEFGQAYQRVYVMYSMMTGRAININDEIHGILHHAAWQRLATLRKAHKMGLTATPDQVVASIQSQPLFRNRQTGQFDKNAYDAFVAGFLPRAGMTAQGFEAMMAENVLINKAASMAAEGALVTDEEVRRAFHLYSDKLTVAYASIPRNLVAAPQVSEEDARRYYEQNPEQFRMPEKAIVKYVQFPVAGYTNSVVVTDEMIVSAYEGNKQRFRLPAAPDAPEGALPAYKPLEEVRGEIAAEITATLARQEAFNAADAIVAKLADASANFDQVTAAAGLKIVANTPAFSATDSVKGVDPTAPFARAAFGLQKDETHYYSDPVVGRDFVYVIALDKKLEPFLPAFDIVKADAMESARIAAAEQAYIEKADEVHARIDEALKGGTTFVDAIAVYGMQPTTLGPFDATTRLDDPHARELMGATLLHDAGTLVDLIPTDDEYLLAYVAGKEPGDEVATLPAMRDELVSAIRNEKAMQLANAWQESLLEEAGFEDLTKNPANGES